MKNNKTYDMVATCDECVRPDGVDLTVYSIQCGYKAPPPTSIYIRQ